MTPIWRRQAARRGLAIGIGVTQIGCSLVGLAPLMICAPAVGDELYKLIPGDGAPRDRFARFVGISGNRAIIGVAGDDDNGTDSGSAYLFDLNTGEQIAKLLPSDGAEADDFGWSVDNSGNTAIVGAYLDDNDNGHNAGSAYLFDTTTGAQSSKLTPNDGAANEWFGYSVGISGNTAIVGAHADNDNGGNSGSAYLFDVNTGAQHAKLLPSDGAVSDFFGKSVGISGNTAIIGAPLDDDHGLRSGSAYLFDVTTGSQVAKILPSDGMANDRFGSAVSISGSTAIVSGGGTGVYVFDVTTGSQIAKLTPSDGVADGGFGGSIDISGDTAIVGAWGENVNGTDSGSAYLFDVITGEQLVQLIPSDGADGDSFGGAVGISGIKAIVGASGDDDNGTDSGSAYVFGVSSTVGDFNGDGSWDCLDIDALVAAIASGSGDTSYDLTDDGLVNIADLDEWRVQGGAANLSSGNPYLVGDANLDGTVDGQDYVIWNDRKFTNSAAWCSGDFTADGVVDGQDFIKWNIHKFMASDSVTAVPEPGTFAALLAAATCLAMVRGRRLSP